MSYLLVFGYKTAYVGKSSVSYGSNPQSPEGDSSFEKEPKGAIASILKQGGRPQSDGGFKSPMFCVNVLKLPKNFNATDKKIGGVVALFM